MRRILIVVGVAALALIAGCETTCPTPDIAGGGDAAATASQQKILVNRDKDGLALQGYDPVAYFTDNKPLKGDAKYRTTHGGATYQFASAEHKTMFDADPARYEPAFGGYCGYAASINKVSPISVEYFQVLDGRLVLQHNQRAWDAWNKDVPGNLKKADANWPGLVAKNGKPAKILVNIDSRGVAVMGYDVIAYRTDGRPVMGTPEHESVYGGARYWFASKEHRDMFEQDPAKYEPQFGGYCAYAASINKISPIDPAHWEIVSDRLLLQHTPRAHELFDKDPQGNLAKADRNWPGLVEKNGK
jgi:YHS domain-containing protein